MGKVRTIFAVDPGETTGYAFGAFPGEDTVGKSLRNPLYLKVLQTGKRANDGLDYLDSAEVVGDAYLNFSQKCRGKDWPRPELVFEDFLLRTQSRDKAALSPIRITGMVLGYLRGSGVSTREIYQQPSEAKSFATDDRLKNVWGVWMPGMVHGRDATRHLCLRLAKQIQGK